MTKCEHKNFSLEIVIDRSISGLSMDGSDKKLMQEWADHESFKTTKRGDDCGEQL